ISIHPYEFSYYNGIIGGLRGASALGFPRSYWLQAHQGTLEYLNQNMPQQATIATEETAVLQAYQEFGKLRSDLVPCRMFNAASAKKCQFYLRHEPLKETKAATLQKLFSFSLEGVDLSSVYAITPEYI